MVFGKPNDFVKTNNAILWTNQFLTKSQRKVSFHHRLNLNKFNTLAIVLTFSFTSIADKQTIKSLMAKFDMGESMNGSVTLSIKQLITQRGPRILKRTKKNRITIQHKEYE